MTPSTSLNDNTRVVDTEALAQRARGAAAADIQAQQLRGRYAKRSDPDPQDLFRRLESIEAAVYALSVAVDIALERSDAD